MFKFFIQFNFIIELFMLSLIIYLTLNQPIHPISLMIMMIIFNLIIFLYLSTWKITFIYSIMLFLIMISGLLIIFMYFSSLISNEKMNFNFNKKFLLFYVLNLLLTFIFLFNNNSFINFKFNFFISDSSSMKLLFFNKFYNIMNMYTYPFSNLTLLFILFILFIFISIIKLNFSSHSSSMRKII